MGLCHEFGSQIRNGCNHPMRAGASACSCADCGVVCRGLFDGCPDVWARGPRPVSITATRAAVANGAPTTPATAPGPRPATGRTGVARAGEGRGAGEPGIRSAEARTSDGGSIAFLEVPPVAIGPGIVGRPGPDPRHDQRAAGGSRGDADPGPTQSDDPSAEADAGRDTPGDPRREVFRWFEEAFEGVRVELQALVGSMTHQQAMLAELLDSRQAELRLALVAESLPDLVADAVGTAMEEHTSAMAGAFEGSHERFRDDVEQIRVDTAATVESLSLSFHKLTDAIAVHDEEAEQRETVRLGTLKGSVTRQVTPLADSLADLAAKVDALTERLGESGRSTPSRGAPVAAPPALKALAANRSASKVAPPTVGQRVATARMKRSGAAADDAPVAPRRVATARGAAPEPPADEPESRTNGTAAAPVAGRVATGRVATGRVATGRVATGRVATGRVATGRTAPAARPAATARPAPATAQPATSRVETGRPTTSRVATSRVATSRMATSRMATSRVAAAKASAESEADEPMTAPVARVLTRRPASTVPDEPLVVYELEAEEEPDDDEEADWAPPAWVSAAARERGGFERATTTRSGTAGGRPTRPPT